VEELHLIINEGTASSHFGARVKNCEDLEVVSHVCDHANDGTCHRSIVTLVIEENSNVGCSAGTGLRHLLLKEWPQRSLAERNVLILHNLEFSKLPLIL